GVNVACLIPHGNVRCAVMGLEERAPTATELSHMEALVAQNMDEGAFGLSTGLVYPPGAYSETDELVSLAAVASRGGGLYASHVRDEGAGLVGAIDEAISIGEQAELPVQISHHKAAGRMNWGKVRTTLGMLDAARERGLVIHSDMYPYTAGSTMLAAMIVPLWVFSAPTPEESLARLADPKLRPRLVEEVKKRVAEHVVLPGILDRFPKRLLVPIILGKMAELIVVGSVKKQRKYEGKTLREVARMRGRPLIEALLDLLVEEDGAVTVVAHAMCEEDVQEVLRDAHTMVGTDGMPTLDGKPHPRAYGTYPRILEHYVGRLGLFDLETAVHKMTGMPARKFRLQGRGVIEPGAMADLVLLRPERIRDHSTYEDPRAFPEGIDRVWVSGETVFVDGRMTGARPGSVLHPG
ncbi:MAG: amidohydrolase family protein, partial [Myxococcota bacterium]